MQHAQATKKNTINYTYIPAQTEVSTTPDVTAQAALAQTANTSGRSLSQLSAIQAANNPQVKMDSPLNAEAIGMSQHASLNWDGPVEGVLQKIAKMTNYKLNVIGVAPATPILVTIHARDKNIATILRDIRYQTIDAKRGQIRVYPGQRIIELRYNNH